MGKFEYIQDHVKSAHLSNQLCSQEKKLFLHADVKERLLHQLIMRIHDPAGLYLFSSFAKDVTLWRTDRRDGGPGWTRTSDPALIKRVL